MAGDLMPETRAEPGQLPVASQLAGPACQPDQVKELLSADTDEKQFVGLLLLAQLAPEDQGRMVPATRAAFVERLLRGSEPAHQRLAVQTLAALGAHAPGATKFQHVLQQALTGLAPHAGPEDGPVPLPELLAAVRPFAEQLGQVSITALAARLSTLAPVLDDDLRARAIEVCALACAPVGDLPALWTPQPTVGAAAAAAWLRAVEADAATVTAVTEKLPTALAVAGPARAGALLLAAAVVDKGADPALPLRIAQVELRGVLEAGEPEGPTFAAALQLVEQTITAMTRDGEGWTGERVEGTFTGLHRILEDIFDFVEQQGNAPQVERLAVTVALWMANEPVKFRLEFQRALPALVLARKPPALLPALLPALPALEPVEWASVPHLLPAMRALLASDQGSAPHVAALVVAAFTAPELYVDTLPVSAPLAGPAAGPGPASMRPAMELPLPRPPLLEVVPPAGAWVLAWAKDLAGQCSLSSHHALLAAALLVPFPEHLAQAAGIGAAELRAVWGALVAQWAQHAPETAADFVEWAEDDDPERGWFFLALRVVAFSLEAHPLLAAELAAAPRLALPDPGGDSEDEALVRFLRVALR